MAPTRSGSARRAAGALVLAAAVTGLGVVVTPAGDAAAVGCAAGVESDFNGDGYADAAVGDPSATVGGQVSAGRVVVLYGDGDNRIGEGARGTVSQGAVGVGDTAEVGDRFGFAIAAADLNCDGYTDLVVGTPYEDVGRSVDSGQVQVVWGADRGLGTGPVSVQYTRAGFGSAPTPGDRFGYAIDALEDVGQGGTPAPNAYAIAIGVPGWDVAGQDDAGLVALLVAYAGSTVTRTVSENAPGIPGAAEAGDRFGTTVTLNYLTGDPGIVDVAIGVPYEDVGALVDAGAVIVVQDVYLKDFNGGIEYDQDSAGVQNTAEAGDRFGAALDSIRVGGTTRLVVGVPFEDISAVADAGLINTFSSDGTTITPGEQLGQASTSIAGDVWGWPEDGDRFGSALAYIPPGPGDPVTRLAVGVPGEDNEALDSGVVQVLQVDTLAGNVHWTQDLPGVPGVAETGDRFGAALAAVEGPAERVLLVGVPDDVTNPAGMVDVLPIGGAAPRAWVPGAGGDRFGGSLASSGF